MPSLYRPYGVLFAAKDRVLNKRAVKSELTLSGFRRHLYHSNGKLSNARLTAHGGAYLIARGERRPEIE